MDQLDRVKIQAAMRLANAQDEFAASLRNTQMAEFTPEEMGRVTGLTGDQIRQLLNAWGLDT